MSRLCFCYGTVHAGKSKKAKLLRKQFLKNDLATLLMVPFINHQDDIGKYDYLIDQDENIFLTVKKKFSNVQLLIIDDAHLLKEIQIDELLQIAINLNIAVLCFGLRTDFRTNYFPGSRRLLELSQVLVELKTYCDCGQKALFSIRKEAGKITFAKEKLINNQEITYEAICPKCYYRKLINYKRLKEKGML